MRPSAQIQELTLPVEGQGGIIRESPLDMFDLVLLPQVATDFHSIVAWFLKSFERLIQLDDLRHLFFDVGKIILSERMLEIKVIVESTINGRTKGELHAVKEAHYGPSHDVGTTVSHHPESFSILLGEDSESDGPLLGQAIVEANDLTVDFRGNGGLDEPGPNIGSDIGWGGL